MVIRRGQSFFVVSRLDRRGQSSWSVALVLSVLLGRRGQSFIFSWSVSRLNRCGQSSWSVVLRGQSYFLVVVVSRFSWMVFIFYGGYAHVFTETYGWGKPRSLSGQMYGGWVEHVSVITKLDRNRSRMSIIT